MGLLKKLYHAIRPKLVRQAQAQLDKEHEREKFERYFNEKVINHGSCEDILKRIREIRLSGSYNGNGLQGLVDHFVKIGVLKPTQNGSHSVDYTVLDSYFRGEMGLAVGVIHADPEFKKGYADKLQQFVEAGGTNIDFVCEPFVRVFSEFSPDMVVFTGYGQSMAECLAHRLEKVTEREIEPEYLSGKNEFGQVPERKANGVIIYETHKNTDFDGKNVLVVDRLMDPFTVLGMAEAVQEQGAHVIGVAGLFATQMYDPQYALPVAKINVDGWKESNGWPFSPGHGKFAFYFPVETAHMKKDYKFRQDSPRTKRLLATSQ